MKIEKRTTILIIIVAVVILAIALAYYFLVYKPQRVGTIGTTTDAGTDTFSTSTDTATSVVTDTTVSNSGSVIGQTVYANKNNVELKDTVTYQTIFIRNQNQLIGTIVSINTALNSYVVKDVGTLGAVGTGKIGGQYFVLISDVY